MPSAKNALVRFEAGQNPVPMTELTDSGDHITFDSGASLWSGRDGYAPEILPNGIKTGGAVTPASAAGTDDVDVAAFNCNLNGVVTVIPAATDVAITRPATNVAKVNSITLTAAGAIAVVAGADGADASFTETRGVAGGPPLIPVDSVEIAQVRVASSAAAVITPAQIFAVSGLHREDASYAVPNPVYDGGQARFAYALPAIHTGNTAKKVFASYATPIFSDVALASDFVAPETTHSVSSTQVYGGVVGSTSSSIQQGKFSAFLQDGVTDPLVTQKDQSLWFKFYPDQYKAPYLLMQGVLGLARKFPSTDNIKGDFTLSCERAAREVV
jgi:hypothetical protein